MARNFARSSSGWSGSSASASTRALKSSQDSSRLRNRSSGSGSSFDRGLADRFGRAAVERLDGRLLDDQPAGERADTVVDRTGGGRPVDADCRCRRRYLPGRRRPRRCPVALRRVAGVLLRTSFRRRARRRLPRPVLGRSSAARSPRRPTGRGARAGSCWSGPGTSAGSHRVIVPCRPCPCHTTRIVAAAGFGWMRRPLAPGRVTGLRVIGTHAGAGAALLQPPAFGAWRRSRRWRAVRCTRRATPG